MQVRNVRFGHVQARKIGFGDVTVSELKEGHILKPDGTMPLPSVNREIGTIKELSDGVRQFEVGLSGHPDVVEIITRKGSEVLKGFNIIDQITNIAKKAAKKVTH